MMTTGRGQVFREQIHYLKLLEKDFFKFIQMIFTLTYSICVSKKDKIKKDVQKCFSVGFFREETYLRVKGANIDERYFVLFFQFEQCKIYQRKRTELG